MERERERLEMRRWIEGDEREGVSGWRGGVGASEGVARSIGWALVASGSKKSRRAESGAVAGKACIRATSG